MNAKWFHGLRSLAWAVQIPVALATNLKTSVAYLVFLSLAALVESSLTDFFSARKDEAEASRTRVVEADEDA